MSRGGHRKLRPATSSRPSMFFLVALAVGIAVLIWLATVLVRQKVAPPGKRAAIAHVRRST